MATNPNTGTWRTLSNGERYLVPNPSSCQCWIDTSDPALKTIRFCRVHAAAPAMLALIKKMERYTPVAVQDEARALLRAVEGA
jgi:hypothetical protein